MNRLRALVRSFPLHWRELLLVLVSILPLGWVMYWSHELLVEPRRTAQAVQEVPHSS